MKMKNENEEWILITFPESHPLYISSYEINLNTDGRILEGSLDGKYATIAVYKIITNRYIQRRIHRLLAAVFGSQR